ncbi:hypothetical protein OG985_48125 [Streptomyces sp. NBC_00289]|uniref:hypothetical protein n=1 Tax=Streptomyces sp. NBC_00289 TaxID=2975703 RepID=UPI00324D2B33
MAVVRSEFRTEIYVPAPDDPVFIADECAVMDCDRRQRRPGADSATPTTSGSASAAARR